MRTDRFSDSIRRKLDSIRPDFRDKDWTRLQAALQASPPPSGSPTGYQPATGNALSTQSWLLAAATISTVLLIGFAIRQQTQINDLRLTVSQLNRQLTTPMRSDLPETAGPNRVALSSRPGTRRSKLTASRPDTVYITRYIAAPAQPANSARDQTADQSVHAPGGPPVDRTRSLGNGQTYPQLPTRSAAINRRNDLSNNTLSISEGTINDVTTGPVNPSVRPTNKKTAIQPRSLPDADGPASGERPLDTTPKVTAVNDPAAGKGRTTNSTGATDRDVSGQTSQLTGMDALTTRPITIDIPDWNDALTRRARRMRPVRTTTVGGPQAPTAPASQPVSRVAVGFRIGAGADVSPTVRSGSLLTEFLVGKHLTLGVGVSRASFAGGSFLTDVDFDKRKRRDFRREYARTLDPRSDVFNPRNDILNIGTHTVRVRIPLSLGYRIPVSRTFSLLPSVGTALNLQSNEFVTFTYRQPLRNFEAANYRIPRPVNLLSSLTFGAGVEWQRSHWVWQAGPLLTVRPVTDTHWHEGSSIGLRARVFYQF